jgi:hypothetical protein
LYLVVQVSTMVYFVPEQERLSTDTGSPRDALRARASRWHFVAALQGEFGADYVYAGLGRRLVVE